MADAVRGVDGTVRLAEPSGRWVLLATVLGSGMAMLDGTVVNIALPTIGKEPGRLARRPAVDGHRLYPHAGRADPARRVARGPSRPSPGLPDRVWSGSRSPPRCAGCAPDIGVLIAARALQGVGGALLAPGSLAIIQATFVPEDRPRAVGAWSGLGGVAGAVGPFLGGWIVTSRRLAVDLPDQPAGRRSSWSR